MLRRHISDAQNIPRQDNVSPLPTRCAFRWNASNDHGQGRGSLKPSQRGCEGSTHHGDQTNQIRPYISGAVLRNVHLTQTRYESFIALQDKLHQNLARQRSLCSIGTHDLDTLQGPFTYDALPPKEINFVPLNQTKSMDGEELMQYYEVNVNRGLRPRGPLTILAELTHTFRRTSISVDICTSFVTRLSIR